MLLIELTRPAGGRARSPLLAAAVHPTAENLAEDQAGLLVAAVDHPIAASEYAVSIFAALKVSAIPLAATSRSAGDVYRATTISFAPTKHRPCWTAILGAASFFRPRHETPPAFAASMISLVDWYV